MFFPVSATADVSDTTALDDPVPERDKLDRAERKRDQHHDKEYEDGKNSDCHRRGKNKFLFHLTDRENSN